MKSIDEAKAIIESLPNLVKIQLILAMWWSLFLGFILGALFI